MSLIDSAFGIHAEALRFRSQRSSVLAANIANSVTPGFKARDYDFREALQAASSGARLNLATTRAGHLNGGADTAYGGLLYRVPTKVNEQGNSVESEVEQAAYADNAVRYQVSLQFLSGAISGLRLAIRGQ